VTVPDAVRDMESAPFFDGTARGELMIKRCDACGHHLRPVALACTVCHGADLSWAVASGEGTIVSWVVVHGRDGATVAGVVELREGPWMDARLVDVDPAALAVGHPLAVRFVDAGEEKVPVFVSRTA
jgi:uncharacterized OB-fold protein